MKGIAPYRGDGNGVDISWDVIGLDLFDTRDFIDTACALAGFPQQMGGVATLMSIVPRDAYCVLRKLGQCSWF